MRVDATTICGTDIHILKGDVPTVVDGHAGTTGALKVLLTRTSIMG